MSRAHGPQRRVYSRRCRFPDAHTAWLGNTSSHTVVERLLSITGEDMLTVDRKFRDPWSGKLPTRFVVLSNELPRLATVPAPSRTGC